MTHNGCFLSLSPSVQSCCFFLLFLDHRSPRASLLLLSPPTRRHRGELFTESLSKGDLKGEEGSQHRRLECAPTAEDVRKLSKWIRPNFFPLTLSPVGMFGCGGRALFVAVARSSYASTKIQKIKTCFLNYISNISEEMTRMNSSCSFIQAKWENTCCRYLNSSRLPFWLIWPRICMNTVCIDP